MQIGISSYSYERLARRGEIDSFGIIKKTKEFGFDAIEFSGIPGDTYEKRVALAKDIRKACEDAGLLIANFSTGADLIKGSDWDLVKETDRIKKEIDIAAILGVDKMRHDTSFGFGAGDPKARTLDYYLDRISKGCKILTTYAKGAGIRTMTENHGKYCQHSSDVMKIYNAVDDDNFGCLIDFGNFLCVDEDPVEGVSDLAPFAFHVHAKDFHFKEGSAMNPGNGWFITKGGNYLRGSIIGHGDVPLRECINVMKTYNYSGVLSIEFEGIEDNFMAIEYGYNNLKRLVNG
jgi:sugar phosphate isomerase/epimerase